MGPAFVSFAIQAMLPQDLLILVRAPEDDLSLHFQNCSRSPKPDCKKPLRPMKLRDTNSRAPGGMVHRLSPLLDGTPRDCKAGFRRRSQGSIGSRGCPIARKMDGKPSCFAGDHELAESYKVRSSKREGCSTKVLGSNTIQDFGA